MWIMRYAVVTGAILMLTLGITFSLIFFPDHTPNAPPPCLTEQTIIYILQALTFPMIFMITHNPIEFEPLLWTLVILGFILSAMLWAVPVVLIAKIIAKYKTDIRQPADGSPKPSR
jgi:hypothetical protein